MDPLRIRTLSMRRGRPALAVFALTAGALLAIMLDLGGRRVVGRGYRPPRWRAP